MVTCSVCKQTKETRNRWIIKEHSVDNEAMREFKTCDDCGTGLIRNIMAEMRKEKDEPLEDTIDLGKSGLIKSINLGPDNHIEIVLSMDLAKARKVVLNETEEKK